MPVRAAPKKSGRRPVGSGLTTNESPNPSKSPTNADITASTADFTTTAFVLEVISAVSLDSL